MTSKQEQRFNRFCRAFLRQTKGRWVGQPLALELWQRQIIYDLLAVDPATSLRRYREALLGLPRKNGKSTLCSALALYLLVVEGALGEGGAEVYSAAASKDQAKIVFNQAKEMVEGSPLRSWCEIRKDTISVPSTGAVYRVLSSDAPKQHGLNPSAAIIDELHAHKDGGDLYFALRTACLAREQPLVISITTAGSDLSTICGQVYERGEAGEDPTLYFKWLGVQDHELDDRAAWKRANPASWITEDDLERESISLPRSIFEQLHLNRWTGSDEMWLPYGAWDGCKAGPDHPYAAAVDVNENDPTVVAIDIGQKRDTTGVIVAQAKADGTVHVKAMSWAVWAKGKRKPQAHKLLKNTDRVDFTHPEEYLRELARGHYIREAPYDPWRFEKSAEDLLAEGLPMVEHPQTNDRMCPAAQTLFDLAVERKLVHDGDSILKAHIENAVAKDTGRGWKLVKPQGSTKPIDLAVAAEMGVSRAVTSDKRSVWENKRLQILGLPDVDDDDDLDDDGGFEPL